MIASARQSIAFGVPYEFIIVAVRDDAPTLDWCATQPDIRLVVQDGLYGAIRAFDAGIEAAQGDYALLANDDITFLGGTITRALAHIETHPTCGAVAIADDRGGLHAGGKLNDPDGFGVQTLTARGLPPGQPQPYAQVGLFRRRLLQVLGGWGHNDPVLRQGATYGGDNYASARMLEFGYSIDTVPRCRVHDTVVEDDLRAINHAAEQKQPAMYYKRYPTGPLISPVPLIPPRAEERLRVLYLPIYEPGSHYAVQKRTKHGLRDALAEIALVQEVDWVDAWRNRRFDLASWVDAWQPHILLTQFQAAEDGLAERVIAGRRVKPDMLMLNWSGDVYKELITSPEMLTMLRGCGAMQLVVNAAVLPAFEAARIPAAYWQCAYEPVDEASIPDAMAHDVVFLGNVYTDARRRFDDILRSIPSISLGLYGSGHQVPAANTTYDFPASAALIRRAKIVVSDNQYRDDIGFVSDRIFNTMAQGGFLLHQHIEGIEDWLGLIPGVHFVEYERIEDLPTVIPYWLSATRRKQRQKIARAGQAEVLKNHSFQRRLDQLFDRILPMMEGEREYA